jgi:hypothetical protein
LNPQSFFSLFNWSAKLGKLQKFYIKGSVRPSPILGSADGVLKPGHFNASHETKYSAERLLNKISFHRSVGNIPVAA